MLTSDMKTHENTRHIVGRTYKRLWLLRRVKNMGCPAEELVIILKQNILPLLEVAAPFWTHMLTKKEKKSIEKVMKNGLQIIFGLQYSHY